jgi:AraC-like DNA-binding protein
MASAFADYARLKLTTDEISFHERPAVMRELFGRQILNLDLEPDPDEPLSANFDLRALPDLKIVTGSASGVRSRRTREMLSDGNDDLFLSLNQSDVFAIRQSNREALLRPGDAALVSCAEPMAFQRKEGIAIGISVPRRVFAHLSGVIEDRVAALIPASNEPLRLLRAYVNSLDSDNALETPALRHLVVAHIHDLLLLAVSGMESATEQAIGRGLKAARLRQIKAHIVRELTSDLSIHAVAVAHHLTERYVQRLFEDEGTTFSTFVSQQRLARAYRMLQDMRHVGRSVSAIAYECGFGDVTHFNRMFRRLYDLTPSDVRARWTLGSNQDEGDM